MRKKGLIDIIDLEHEQEDDQQREGIEKLKQSLRLLGVHLSHVKKIIKNRNHGR